MRVLLIAFVVVAVVAMVRLETTAAQEHVNATVTKVRAETEDRIAFEISVTNKTYDQQEDVPVNYVVQNNSRRIVHLITVPVPRMRFIETFVVHLIEPVKGPNSHERYDYQLIKILPGKSYHGNLSIKAKQLIESDKYNFETVTIQTAFAYLFDTSNLAGCKEAQDPLPCLTQIYNRSKTLTVGQLVIIRKVK